MTVIHVIIIPFQVLSVIRRLKAALVTFKVANLHALIQHYNDIPDTKFLCLLFATKPHFYFWNCAEFPFRLKHG